MTTLLSGRLARLDAAEFDAMIESGVFGDRRVFLWGGRIFEKMAKTKANAVIAFRIAKLATAVLPGGWDVWHENPIQLDRRNVPLPDLAVIRGPDSQYLDRRPQPNDVGILIEVPVTSLAKDLGPQAAKYARSGVACYWVVDARHRRVVEHRDPQPDGTYATVREHGPGDEVEVILDGVTVGRIAVSDLF
jgi:Uma2 family endonuclease